MYECLLYYTPPHELDLQISDLPLEEEEWVEEAPAEVVELALPP